MDARQQRGLEIAAISKIQQKGKAWIVPSQSGQGKYTVCPDAKQPYCSCPDHEATGGKCKHIYAVEIVIEREYDETDGSIVETKTIKTLEVIKTKTYPQDWRAYNNAQTTEKSTFQVLLFNLCKGLHEPQANSIGRPRLPLDDAIFSAVFKVFSTLSGRRFISDLGDAQSKGYIRRVPHFNSIFNVFDKPGTSEVLTALIEQSAAPLKTLESNFACDSSGFSGSRMDRWYDHKFGERKIKRSWVKCHVMTGTKTNVVTAVEIQGQNANDGAMLPALLKTTTEQFTVKEVSADLAYSTHGNLQAIVDAKAVPYIPFKRNASDVTGGLWAKMLHYFSFKRDEFLARYHQRSNVETTFSMIKAKFGDSVRSKTDRAMKNETLAKILCHNICCLIQSMHEFGIDPSFCAEKSVAQKGALA